MADPKTDSEILAECRSARAEHDRQRAAVIAESDAAIAAGRLIQYGMAKAWPDYERAEAELARVREEHRV